MSTEYYYSYSVMIRAMCTKASKDSGKNITVAFLPLLYIPSEPEYHSLIDEINDVLEKATVENGYEVYHVMSHVVHTCHEGRLGNVTIRGVEMFSPTYFWGSRTSSHLEGRFLLTVRENLKKYLQEGFLKGNHKPEFEVRRKFILDCEERGGTKRVGQHVAKNEVATSVSPHSSDGSTSRGVKRSGKPWQMVDASKAKAAKIRAAKTREKKLEDALNILQAHQKDLSSIKETLRNAKATDSNRLVTDEMSSCNLNKS